jgi:hypothetical protein
MNTYAFSINLFSQQRAGNHVPQNVTVLAADPASATQAIFANYGSDLSQIITGPTLVASNQIGATPAGSFANPTFTGVTTFGPGSSVVIPSAGLPLAPSAGNLIQLQTPDSKQLQIDAPSALEGDSGLTVGGGRATLYGSNQTQPSVQLEDNGGGVGLGAPTSINTIQLKNGLLDGTGIGQGLAAQTNADAQAALTANYNAGAAKVIAVHTSFAAGSMFRIAGTQQIVQGATTSSTMPSLTLNYTDAGGIARTLQLVATSTTNNTTVLTAFSALIFVSNAADITLTSAGYLSSGATAMKYALAWSLEQLN